MQRPSAPSSEVHVWGTYSPPEEMITLGTHTPVGQVESCAAIAADTADAASQCDPPTPHAGSVDGSTTGEPVCGQVAPASEADAAPGVFARAGRCGRRVRERRPGVLFGAGRVMPGIRGLGAEGGQRPVRRRVAAGGERHGREREGNRECRPDRAGCHASNGLKMSDQGTPPSRPPRNCTPNAFRGLFGRRGTPSWIAVVPTRRGSGSPR